MENAVQMRLPQQAWRQMTTQFFDLQNTVPDESWRVSAVSECATAQVSSISLELRTARSSAGQ